MVIQVQKYEHNTHKKNIYMCREKINQLLLSFFSSLLKKMKMKNFIGVSEKNEQQQQQKGMFGSS